MTINTDSLQLLTSQPYLIVSIRHDKLYQLLVCKNFHFRINPLEITPIAVSQKSIPLIFW